jgi:predicted enzyme related to lactoylglutathione lyase
MTDGRGEFIWYELMTTDLEAARTFYGAVIGWEISSKTAMAGMDYRIARMPDADIAGMMQLDQDMIAGGGRPIWVGYIAVDDVDTTAAGISAGGGKIFIPPQDIPGVGRFAMAADPDGAPFYIMRGSVEGGVSTAFSPAEIGHCGWNELTSPDQAAALKFYMDLFGWTNPSSMPLGPAAFYRFLFADDVRIGASVEQADLPASWLFYFRVPSIGSAIKAVKAHGGQIAFGPQEVPEGDVIVIGTDPQGARFALVGRP